MKSAYILNYGSDTDYEIHDSLLKKGSIVDLNLKSFDVLHVPFYPEDRFVKKISQQENKTILVTGLPLWKRNALGTYKTLKQKEEMKTIKKIDMIEFNQPVFISDFKLIKP